MNEWQEVAKNIYGQIDVEELLGFFELLVNNISKRSLIFDRAICHIHDIINEHRQLIIIHFIFIGIIDIFDSLCCFHWHELLTHYKWFEIYIHCLHLVLGAPGLVFGLQQIKSLAHSAWLCQILGVLDRVILEQLHSMFCVNVHLFLHM